MNVFSFCIYGPENPKYYRGLIENIQIINQAFPGWKIFIYAGLDVSQTYKHILVQYPQVILRETGILGHKNSVHRFFAIDEPNVDIMIVRDVDSRIHWKDQWAIRNFVESTYGAHIVRDHKEHMAQMLAGLWGIRKNVLSNSVRTLFNAWTPVYAGSGDSINPNGFGIDQNFLKLVIYPQIKPIALVNYSFNCLLYGENGVPFPFEWSNDVYCGRVELEHYDAYFSHPRKNKVLNLPYGNIRVDTRPIPVRPPSPPPVQIVKPVRNTPLFLNFLNRR